MFSFIGPYKYLNPRFFLRTTDFTSFYWRIATTFFIVCFVSNNFTCLLILWPNVATCIKADDNIYLFHNACVVLYVSCVRFN